MKYAPLLLLTVALPVCFGQTATIRSGTEALENPQLRAEAVRLLEEAGRVSTPAVWPSNEMSIHFRLGQPDPGQPFEGDYISSVGAPGTRRMEWRYGTFEHVQVRNGGGFTVTHAQGERPGILDLIPQLTPVWVGRFDHEDIIRSISSGTNGTCIDFETAFGDSRQQNQICVDSEHGWLISTRVGDETTRNSNYFAFSGAFLPGHIEHWVGDKLVIAMDQTIVPKEFPADFFGASATRPTCGQFRPPTPVHVPQPEPLTATKNVYEIVLTGLITTEGKVTSLKSADNVHPDLNREAIALVSGWIYTGATCNGAPTAATQNFVVRFKGR